MAKTQKKIYVFSETSHNIEVKVAPIFLDDESSRVNNKYVWAYHVQIYNHSKDPVQLMYRHWLVTDGYGKIHEMRGEGVVGEQPTILPQAMYEYTSAVPLNTPTGFMKGTYEVMSHGQYLHVGIPCFSLDCPFYQNVVH